LGPGRQETRGEWDPFAEAQLDGDGMMLPAGDRSFRGRLEAWAAKLRDSRHIGDFRGWKDHDAYQTTLTRLLRDLRVEPT
jgi:hypothetical protein